MHGKEREGWGYRCRTEAASRWVCCTSACWAFWACSRASRPAPSAPTHPPALCSDRHRIALAAQREEERRNALTSRLEAKQQRVAAMEAEKEAMLRALQAVHKEIAVQEGRLR